MVTTDGLLSVSLAEQGLGLAYAAEPWVMPQLRSGRLKKLLESYAPTVPGHFLYFPSRAQRSAPLRLFVAAAKRFSVSKLKNASIAAW